MRSPEEERSVVLDLQKQITEACPYEQEDPNKEESKYLKITVNKLFYSFNDFNKSPSLILR